jgi:hypothetical protein
MPRAPELEGRYANHFDVGHNAFEFVIDFGQAYDPADVGRSHTRIVTSPFYAKALIEMLTESMRCYESRFGETVKPVEG